MTTDELQTPSEILKLLSYRFERRKTIVHAIVSLLLLLAILIVLVSVFGIASVSGTSMEPTYHAGDVVVISKIKPDYKVGSIIVYKTANGTNNVKRVVAMPGDVLSVADDGQLLINGFACDEGIYFDTYPKSGGISYPYTVEEGKVFVMGDHRTTSVDSRDAGAVCTAKIIGTVIFSIETD